MKIKLTTGQEVETGCYVDCHRGFFDGTRQAGEVARDFGWTEEWPFGDEPDDENEMEVLVQYSDDALEYLNSILPEDSDCYWEWVDGDLMLTWEPLSFEVCNDCFCYAAYGTNPEDSIPMERRVMFGQVEQEHNVNLVNGDEEYGFCMTSCEVCRSPLGGDRYQLVGIKR